MNYIFIGFCLFFVLFLIVQSIIMRRIEKSRLEDNRQLIKDLDLLEKQHERHMKEIMDRNNKINAMIYNTKPKDNV